MKTREEIKEKIADLNRDKELARDLLKRVQIAHGMNCRDIHVKIEPIIATYDNEIKTLEWVLNENFF